MNINKLTENETIKILIDYLENKGWKIESSCFDQERGNDIVASKNKRKLIIEVKGAKAGDNSPTKKRTHFSRGQIKTHFGKAIVKILEEKSKNPNLEYAIAQPDDNEIRIAVGHLITYLDKLEIKHFWVSKSKVIEE